MAKNDGQKIAAAPGAAPSATFDGPKVTVSLYMLFQHNGSHWANQAIKGATVEVKGGGPKATSNKLGFALLTFKASEVGKPITLLISHTAAESSSALAGPSLGQAQNPSMWHFRPFEVDVETDMNGIVDKSVPVVRQTVVPDGPPYALLYKSAPKLLELDWRPDFLRGFTRRPRAANTDVTCLVLHHTGKSNIGSVLNTFYQSAGNTPAGQGAMNAAHYLVALDGHVLKLGHESERMRHAGESIWQGEKSVNDFGIGIEILHDNHVTGYQGLGKPQFDNEGFPEAQMKSVIRLVQEIRAAYKGITRQRVVGHGDIGSTGNYVDFILGRKSFEPDIHFDWKALEDLGLCRKPMDVPEPAPPLYGLAGPGKKHVFDAKAPKSGQHFLDLKKDLFEIGYSVSPQEITSSTQLTDATFDKALSAAIAAFEQRYMSGSRAKDASWPRYGHLSWETAVLIKRVLADTGA